MREEVVSLTRRLVETPSVSGGEARCVALLAEWLEARGCAPRISGRNVSAVKGRGARALLLNSHLDTVPAAPGWTRDPHRADVEGDRLYGLGSADAKGCVAAMACAFAAAPDPGEAGTLVFAATCDEETGGQGLEVLVKDLPPLAAGVVGEPTDLAIAIGQRGLVRIVLEAEGKAGHASRPWEGTNAIEVAARDVVALGGLRLPAPDPLLGPATIQATLIQGGVRANVIPPACSVTLDVRTTPSFPNEAAIEAVRAACRSRVVVRSTRFRPVVAGVESDVVRAARAARLGAELVGFGGVSDLLHVAPAPGVIVGPGSGKQSHQADEFTSVAALLEAVRFYAAVAGRFFGGEGRP